ncbi:MAG: flagellar hook capping protein [Burkholderiales bacterium]|nr:flagellar hook capping protein [Burkholderiales bacterium]
MALDPITAAPAGNTNLQAAGITQQDFLKILLTQLTQQDPLKPMDNTQFVTQLAQFSQLEQTQEISTNTANAIAVQTATQTVGLLGKTVTVQSNSGTSTSGVVSSIDFSGNAPLLTVSPSSGKPLTGVRLSQIIAAH